MRTAAPPAVPRQWSRWGLTAAVAIGITLRLAWPADIEWKADERWTFEQARAMAAGSAWPAIGMPTSVGLPNPGLSVWVFGGLAWLTGTDSPPDLARGVQLLNAAALVLLVLLTVRCVPRDHREPWLWAAALVAVNPVLVILERKIWPPSVLPIFIVGLCWSWWRRRFAPGAFGWGLVGAVIGQVHPAAFGLTIAIALWTAIADRRGAAWRWWIAGSVVGALPLIAWTPAAMQSLSESRLGTHGINPTLYLRWISQSIGVDAHYTLGFTIWSPHFLAYLRGPSVAGVQTHAMALAHIVMLGVAAVLAGRFVHTRPAWPSWRVLLLGHTHDGTLWIAAAWWGYLGLLTLARSNVHRHYLIAVSLPMAMGVAHLALAGSADRRWARRLLATLCLCQALASAGLLSYIHMTQVIEPGEYGPTWNAQQATNEEQRTKN